MHFEPTNPLPAADDGFAAFYAERIWRLIPGIYRDEDARSASPGALRAFVEVIAGQAAAERRRIDRLWADSTITDCDDWAIPQIAALLGTRLISEQNTAGRRADVANTIGYRRRAGTLALLARLADDIAGWDAVPVEAFQRLWRTAHGLDCPARPGQASGTPQHGHARLTAFRVGELLIGPFDDLAHLPDFRRHRGLSGRYNIPKVNLHVFRQHAFLLRGVTPHRFDATHYTLDPSGRDIPLFRPGRPARDACRTGAEWEIRGPLSCALYNDGCYAVDPSVAGATIGAALLELEGAVFQSATALVARAERIKGAALTLAEGAALLETALLPTSNRAQLVNDALALALGSDPQAHLLAPGVQFGGNLARWETATPTPWPWVRALVDPASGRVLLSDPPGPGTALFSLRFFEGRFAPVGAGTHDRQPGLASAADAAPLPDPPPAPEDPAPVAGFVFPAAGIHQLNDSRTCLHATDTDLTLTGDLTVQAANGVRPYIRLEATPAGGMPARLTISADAPGRTLTLDGLWLGMFETGQTPVADAAAVPMLSEIVLAGDFDTVTLRHMTLDPGGIRARTVAGQSFVIPAIRLVLQGAINRVVIDRCVTGPIEEAADAGDRCSAGRVEITDSIVLAEPGEPAFRGRHATLAIARSTLFGRIEAARALIDDSVIQGTVSVQDPQGSCVRYSAAVSTDALGIPNAYRSVAFPGAMPNHFFVSRRFGDPGLAQLSQTAPETLRRGAGNTSEMGAYSRTLDAIKRDDLIFKLSEFTTINTITQLVFET